MNNQVIPAQAVEAAAKAYYELGFGSWEGAHEDTRQVQREDMAAALEAAAPHMLAAAWEEGDRNGADGIYEPNPYRTARNV